ncbi:PAAT family amino acid ABC transporter substrate-binding protein [Oleiphilus messinensis]|uniref:PAAT family amino acid ABC transporter substrate-binding protein n=1 Tax=Oleiphilus messinensis TaxID=141451 RepID=A0A1Y0I7S3_9GAMM|nr:transporter substrate-binding domain-containing protein [Oleiphilus messinensis]ARU56557.1 PAAT family amino acid ABC transporter substrate-binding protein [Oleiphilus messinensis]
MLYCHKAPSILTLPSTLFYRLIFFWACIAYTTSCGANEDETLAQKPTTIVVGYTEFPPFEFTDEEGNPSGIFLDLTRRILESEGIKAEYISLPINRLYLYLTQGKVHLWPGLSDVPALQNAVLETNVSPIAITLALFHTHLKPAVTDLSQLKDQRLIVVNGYTYGGLIYQISDPESEIIPLYASNHLSGLQMLMKDRGDYFLDYIEPIEELNKNQSFPDIVFSIVKKRQGAFVVSKLAPKPEELIRKLERGYTALLNSPNSQIDPIKLEERK